MVLVRVERPNPCLPEEFTLVYACSQCGTDLHDYMTDTTIKGNVCPICGHVLDKKDKPSRYVDNGINWISCKAVADKFSDEARYQSRPDFEAGDGYDNHQWYEIYIWKFKESGKFGNYAYGVTQEVLKKLNEEGYTIFHKKQWDKYFSEQAEIAVSWAKNMAV